LDSATLIMNINNMNTATLHDRRGTMSQRSVCCGFESLHPSVTATVTLVLLLVATGIQGSAGADEAVVYAPHEKAKSMFLDEVSSTDWYRAEDLYALTLGATYDISFRMRKEPGLSAASAFLSILTHVTKDRRKYEMHWLLGRLGSDVPADGQWHDVQGTFTVKVPEGTSIRPNLNGALRASIILYNKAANGKAVSIAEVKGVPRYVDYRFLGEKDQSLPQILLIGDSTMQHTYAATVEAFDGVASVYFIPVNGGNTKGSVQRIRRWVGGRRWDLIYFNSGIHDLTRHNEKGERGPDYPNSVPLVEYAENLQIIADYLKTTGAKLVWRSTTPLGPRAAGRLQTDEAAYNDRATAVMKANGIPIHDVTNSKREELSKLSSDGVHFTAAGNELLARELFNYVRQQELFKTGSK